MGWVGSFLIILGIWLVGDKSMWGFVCGALGNFVWVYVGLKRGKQFDLAAVALAAAILNLIGLIKWLG